jgi:hypothetical protein
MLSEFARDGARISGHGFDACRYFLGRSCADSLILISKNRKVIGRNICIASNPKQKNCGLVTKPRHTRFTGRALTMSATKIATLLGVALKKLGIAWTGWSVSPLLF